MAKICKNYAGVSCVDGSCPTANYNYLMSKGMPEFAKAFRPVENCSDCHKRKGCEDCTLRGLEYCETLFDLDLEPDQDERN